MYQQLVTFCLLGLVSCLPIEDTPEVAEAKAAFLAAFAAAEAGEHAALAPVNTDEQAPAVEAMYLEDDAPVAEAKAAFLAAFADAEAGGLAALQEPAPVHVIPEPEAPVPLQLPLSLIFSQLVWPLILMPSPTP